MGNDGDLLEYLEYEERKSSQLIKDRDWALAVCTELAEQVEAQANKIDELNGEVNDLTGDIEEMAADLGLM